MSTMKERGIIFSGDNPKLILDGRKTQTRRIIKPQPFMTVTGSIGNEKLIDAFGKLGEAAFKSTAPNYCPFGVAGDRLWVREKHHRYGRYYSAGKTKSGRVRWVFKATDEKAIDFGEFDKLPRTQIGWHVRPSIFLPKKLARTWLEITKVRVERLQDISEEDVKAEGIEDWQWLHMRISPQAAYAALWDSLHGKGAWAENPWVWVIEFNKV